MSSWWKTIPPYEGEEPYLYFAFAEADAQKVWRYLQPLLERGCRVWYCFGPADSSGELLRRQARSGGAALTLLYLTDAACSDLDTKTNVLVNQKSGRQILCLDPDGTDRRLSMGLREDVPHIPLYTFRSGEEAENAILHAPGFSQEMLGEPVRLKSGSLLKRLSVLCCVLALVLAAVSFAVFRFLPGFRPEDRDEVTFADPIVLAAVRKAAGGGAVTEEMLPEIRLLQLDGLPDTWEDLALLPSLERIVLPQQAIRPGSTLPEGDYTLELSGGGAGVCFSSPMRAAVPSCSSAMPISSPKRW